MALDLLPVPIDWTTGTVITIISIIYVYLTWSYDYWKDRNVPFEKPKFFFGNFKDVFYGTRNVGDLVADLYRKHDGNPYVGIYRFLNPALLVRDPDLVKTILIKDFQSFQTNAHIMNGITDPMLSKNPSFISGEKWEKLRSLLAPTFMSGKMKPLLPLIQEVATDMLQYVQDLTASGVPGGIEVKELASKFTMDVMATCVFGVAGQSLKGPDADMWKIGRGILESKNEKSSRYFISFVFPSLSRFFRVRLVKPEIADYYQRVIKKVSEYRDSSQVLRQDYLHQLLQLKARAQEDDSEYTDEDLSSLAVTFLVQGLETSSITLSFLLYELAMNRNIQNKLHESLQGALERNDGLLNYDSIMGLPYLDMVYLETLRKHPPVLVLEKYCTQLYELPAPPGGTELVPIDPGTLILLPVKALHHDPKFFPQPHIFDPGRFSEGKRNAIPRFAYLPFGEGPRLCVGMRFAEILIKVGAAATILHYEVKKSEATSDPIVQDPNCGYAAATGGLWLDFQKRN